MTFHLATTEALFGTGDASAEIRALLSEGLRAIEAEKKAKWHRKTNPSVSDAGRCPRQVAYSLLNTPESNPPAEDSLSNFMLGRLVEEAVGQLLVAAGASFVDQARVTLPVADTLVSGRSDASSVAVLLRGHLIEIKSTSSRAMNWMLRRGEHGRSEHRQQVNLYNYAHWIEAGKPEPKPAAYLLYWIKDATAGEPVHHCWSVPLDVEMAETDMFTLAGIHSLVKSGTIPQRPEGFTQSKFPCHHYCVYKDTCWRQK